MSPERLLVATYERVSSEDQKKRETIKTGIGKRATIRDVSGFAKSFG